MEFWDSTQTQGLCSNEWSLAAVQWSGGEEHTTCLPNKLQSSLLRDELDVRNVLNVLSSLADPFIGVQLHHLSSGRVAPLQLQSDLLPAYSTGDAAMEKLMEERVKADTVSIYAPLCKLRLQTFSSLWKVDKSSGS